MLSLRRGNVFPSIPFSTPLPYPLISPFLTYPTCLFIPPPFLPRNPALGPGLLWERCKLPQRVRVEPGRETGFRIYILSLKESTVLSLHYLRTKVKVIDTFDMIICHNPALYSLQRPRLRIKITSRS